MRRLAAFTISMFLTIEALAQLPGTIGYQGRLIDEGGLPINDTVTMSFSLFESSEGGEPLWTEVQSAVDVDEGYFSVSLGSVTPFDLDFKSQYFLEIKIESDTPMSPRVKLESVPYAERSAAAPYFVVKDSAGTSVGEVIGLIKTSAAVLVSRTGYLFAINLGSGQVVQSQGVTNTIIFDGPDCTGSAYISVNGVGPGAVHPVGGELFYTPKGAPLVPESSVNGVSGIGPTDSATCQNAPYGMPTSLLTLPNDPDVTAVDLQNIQPPLSIVRLQGDSIR